MKRAGLLISACAVVAAGCVLDWDRVWDQGTSRDTSLFEQGPPPDKRVTDSKPSDPNSWAVTLGGQQAASLSNVMVDKAGNVFAGGTFEGKLKNDTTATLSSTKQDVLLTRLSPEGKIVWTISGSSATYDRLAGLFVTGGGELYVTGHFNDTFKLGTMAVKSIQDTDVFVARLSPQGKPGWLVRFGNNASCFGKGLALDSSGKNLWLTGQFGYKTDFGTFSLHAVRDDVFVARLEPSNGDITWVQKAGGGWPDSPTELVLDSAGNAYISGIFRTSATFGTHSLTAGAKSDDKVSLPNAFAASISAKDDKFTWATGGISKVEARAKDVALDGSGNTYITGFFQGKIAFGSHTLTCQGQADLFVVKLDKAGKVLWARDTDGAGREGADGIAVDKAGNVLVAGYHVGPARMGGKDLSGQGDRDVLLAMLDTNGKVLWISSHGGKARDQGVGVALDGQGRAVVTGYFTGEAKLGLHTVTAAKATTADAFVWKFASPLKGPR